MTRTPAAAPDPQVESLPDVVEVERHRGPGTAPHAAADLLLDLPHGATETAHYEALAARLRGPLPDDLAAFFYVNTDLGAPEVAQRVARLLTDPRLRRELAADLEPARRAAERAMAPLQVLVVRSLVPRTFVDCNRLLGAGDAPPAGMTAGLPPYVTNARDQALLIELHARYSAVAAAAYAEVCAAGGLAVGLHTYAPRSVDVEVDADVVSALRHAYRPAVYRQWPRRPDVDLITRDDGGEELAPADLPALVRERFAALGLEVGDNATYHLHPATAGYAHARRWPGRVVCLELRRDRLAAPFIPFAPSPISQRKVARLARPLAAALLDWLARRSS